MRRLTDDQRARVEKLATDAGTTCEGCASARLSCGKEARRTHDRDLLVYSCCLEDVHPRGAYQYFTTPLGEVIGA